MLLVLKLVLVPALVVSVTLAGRRWGPRVGGLLASFPLVAGPILIFFAIEQGNVFAAEAARAALVALAGVSVSSLAYAWIALRTPWWVSLAVSWAGFVVTTLTLRDIRWTRLSALAAAAASFLLAQALLPRSRGAPVSASRSVWDLPLRTLSSVVMVSIVTGLAQRLGPALSGAFTPFPVALGVLLVFTHTQQGPATVTRFLRGFLPGMWSFAVFCFVASLALVPLGSGPGLLLALIAVIPIQAAVLWWLERAGR